MSDPFLRLRSLPLDLVVAGSLPEGFALRDVESENDPDFGAFYRIRYEGPEGVVYVEGSTGGVGDPMAGGSSREFACPGLGSGTLEFYGADSDEPVDFRSHWMQVGSSGGVYSVAGLRLDPEQAVLVAEGLTILP